MRRATRDIALGRRLSPGQTFRHRSTGALRKVRQIHRADCQVELVGKTDKICIPFEQLREQWDQIVPVEEAQAA